MRGKRGELTALKSGSKNMPLFRFFLVYFFVLYFSRLRGRSSGLARQDQGNVIGLLFGADPGVEGQHDLKRDHMQGLVAVAADYLHHALFPELAEIVLRLRDAVRVGDENISRLHVEAVFVIVHAVHQTYDRPTLIESANASILPQHPRRLRSAPGIGSRTSRAACCGRDAGSTMKECGPVTGRVHRSRAHTPPCSPSDPP